MTDKSKTKLLIGLMESLIWVWLFKYDWKFASGLLALQIIQSYVTSRKII